MRVLVVGGTGLIGWHAADELVRRGHAVTALARREPGVGSLPGGVTFVQGDLEDRPAVRRALEAVDGVVFAAGADFRVAPKGSAWEYYRHANVDLPVALFRTAREAGARCAVMVTSYYHVVRPELAQRHAYIKSRAVSEEAALEAASGLSLAILQPPYVMGKVRGRWWLSDDLARYARSRAPLFAPPGGSNWMTARALGEAVAAALERGESGRHLVGDENVTWVSLLARFARAVGRPRSVATVPRGVLRAAGQSYALWTKLRARSTGVDPAAWVDVVTDELFYDASPAAEALGYRRGDLDEAIASVASRSIS